MDRRMLTLAALMPLVVVPATFQVTVWSEPPARVVPLLKLVMANAAPVFTTLRATSSVLTPPPPARLSRTVTRKSMEARLTVGRRSAAPPDGDAVVVAPARTDESFGNVRVGLVVGLYTRNRGLK